MIELKTLKQLVKLMSDNNLSELDLKDGEQTVHLKRGHGNDEPQYVMPQPMQAAPAPAPAAAPPASSGGEAAPAEEAPKGETIDSPMVGTYYAAPSPDADDFVKAGDSVSADTVVCIVEAMKVFNEIKAEKSGTIAEVLIENGQAVEYGQPLFRLK